MNFIDPIRRSLSDTGATEHRTLNMNVTTYTHSISYAHTYIHRHTHTHIYIYIIHDKSQRALMKL